MNRALLCAALTATLLLAPAAAAQTPPETPPAAPGTAPAAPGAAPGAAPAGIPGSDPAAPTTAPAEIPEVPESARFRAFLGGGVGSGYVLHAALAYPGLLRVGPLWLGPRVSADVFGDLGAAGAIEAIATAPFESLTLYAGPGFGLARSGGFASVVLGASLPAFGSLGVYAEGVLRLPFGAAVNLGARVGLTYAF